MKIEGNVAQLSRLPTDLYSLDVALGSPAMGALGIPVPGIIEIFGQTHVGKSTLAYHLASQINPTGRVILCDIEGLDIEYVKQAFEHEGFDGTLRVIDAMDSKGKMRPHEDMLDDLTEEFYKPEVSAGIVDSIGAISPISEIESKIEEGFGAKRAVTVARFVRRLNVPLKGMELPRPLFVINHAHTVVGGGHGHQASGGVALGHLKIASLYLYPKSIANIKSGDDVLAYAIEGKVEKLRYGGRGRTFQFVTVPGRGVSRNLSALLDCVALELVERGAVVKSKDKSYGYISKLVEQDIAGDDEAFADFHQMLKEQREGWHDTVSR